MPSFFETHKDLFASLQAVATIFAFAVGGFWTFLLTRQFRETQPILNIKQNVSSWRLADGTVLVRVDSLLTNISKVQIRGISGKIFLQRLLPETSDQAAQFKAGKIWFDCKALPSASDCVSEQGLNLPASSTIPFPINDRGSALEPGESIPYWRYAHLDAAAKVIEVYTTIEKPGKPGDPWLYDAVYNLDAAASPANPALTRRKSSKTPPAASSGHPVC